VRLVLVEWEDSLGCSSSWAPLEDSDPKVLLCRSVGWLLHDGDQCKTIVPHVTEQMTGIDRQGCGDMTIPTAAIRQIVDLSEPPPPG